MSQACVYRLSVGCLYEMKCLYSLMISTLVQGAQWSPPYVNVSTIFDSWCATY
jgi:hypothetical protein